MRSDGHSPTLPAAATAVLLVWVGLLGAACADGGSPPSPEEAETIARDTFVATYVDLRLTALRDTTPSITEAERQRVLQDHGVTREDLLQFVEVHGQRVEFMRSVWDEVDERLRRAREGGDTASS